MQKFNFTISKAVNYHVSISEENLAAAEKKIKEISRRCAVGKDGCYSSSEGPVTIALDDVEDLSQKEYLCRIWRHLYEDKVIPASCEDDAVDIGFEIAGDMSDSDFTHDESDVEVLKVIYKKASESE